MINGVYVPRWLFDQCKNHGIDTRGLVVIDLLPVNEKTRAEKMRDELSGKSAPQAYLNLRQRGNRWSR